MDVTSKKGWIIASAIFGMTRVIRIQMLSLVEVLSMNSFKCWSESDHLSRWTYLNGGPVESVLDLIKFDDERERTKQFATTSLIVSEIDNLDSLLRRWNRMYHLNWIDSVITDDLLGSLLFDILFILLIFF